MRVTQQKELQHFVVGPCIHQLSFLSTFQFVLEMDSLADLMVISAYSGTPQVWRSRYSCQFKRRENPKHPVEHAHWHPGTKQYCWVPKMVKAKILGSGI